MSVIRVRRWVAVLVMMVFLLAGMAFWIPWPALGGWTLEKEALAQGMPALQKDGVLVIYPPGHEEEASWVLEGVLQYVDPVFTLLHARRPDHIRVMVAADQEELRHDLGTSEAPLGAYWQDTLWILAPSSWPGGPVDRERFLAEGPIAHELGHMALHRRVGEKVPVWLDEGVAQWVDEKVTGFLWLEGWPRLEEGEGFSYQDLSRWQVDDLAVAYLQSYLLAAEIARSHGGEGLALLLDRLEKGHAVNQSLRTVLGDGYPGLVAGDAWQAPLLSP
ncbi:MAG: hypothetical protein QJR00_00415 [Bacillota bacterium]|nr:hypothetical protein [Bacillota bacterium]